MPLRIRYTIVTKMRLPKFFGVVLFQLFVVAATFGQSNDRTNEFFAGFSVSSTSYETELPNLPIPVIVAFDPKQTLIGFNGSYTRYLSKGFGLTGDVSVHFKKLSDPDPLGGNIETKISVWNVVGGPHYKFCRNKRVSPFVHGLVGIAHTRSKLVVPSLSITETLTSTDLFARSRRRSRR